MINLGLDLPFFDGWCRYGSDNREWMNGFAIKNDILCHQKCLNTTGCSAFSFEYNDVEEPCNIYSGGPYTYGNGRINTKCHTIPKGQYRIPFIYIHQREMKLLFMFELSILFVKFFQEVLSARRDIF